MSAAPLNPENIHAFWGSAWQEGRTGWKNHEKDKPFETNMQKFLVALSSDATTPAGTATDVSAFVAGKRVLVPLCGDSHAVRYFVDRKAGLVVGVDIVEDSLQRSIQQNFPASDGFAVTTDVQREDSGTGSSVVVRVFEATSKTLVCALICGDFLDASLASIFGPFDFVYDRASMVAMPPLLRQRYADQVVRCTTPGTRFLLELVRRPVRENDEHLKLGPPFHIPDETVVAHYQAALANHGDRVPQLIPIDALAAAQTAFEGNPAQPDFVFSLYLVKL